jgi:hypothetical protein
MSSYFDDLSTKVTDLSKICSSVDTFAEAVLKLEDDVVHTVNLATGDREFPEDLREKIQNLIALFRLRDLSKPGELLPKAKEWLVTMKEDRLFTELHSAFHVVASRRHVTRFGILFDDPAGIVRRRDDFDENPDGDE